MGPLDREVARQRGRRNLDAMRRRAGQLRRRVVAIAIVGFVLLWTVVFVQMATGNDPALGPGPAARSAAIEERSPGLERSGLPAAVPPPSEDDDEEGAAPGSSETAGLEAERAEAERVEAEQVEIEQREAEARELEELEAITTGQS